MRIELTSQPLNEAIAKLERIAALYERIGGAQGTVAAGPAGGGTIRGGGGGGSRVVSGKSTVGGRSSSVMGGLMRTGFTHEQAMRTIQGNPQLAAQHAAEEAASAAIPSRIEERSIFEEERIANRGRRIQAQEAARRERQQRALQTASAVQAARANERVQTAERQQRAIQTASAIQAARAEQRTIREQSRGEIQQRAIQTASAIQAARAESRTDAENVRVGKMMQRSQELGTSLMDRAQKIRETRAQQEQKRIERFERISNQTSSGRGTGIGGGPGGAGRPFFRERQRLGGTGLVAGIGGPWALGAAAVFGFVTAVRGAIESVNELHKAALITGGSMEDVARLQAMGVKATEANALRARMGSDPFAIMSMGFMPDPRLGGPQNNTPFVQNAILKLRRLRGNPDAQLREARRMGVGEDILAAANLGDASFSYAQQTAAGAPTRKQAQDLADTQSDIKNFGQRLENRAVGFWSRFSDWSDRAQDFVRGHLGLPLFPHGEGAATGKGPDSLQGAMDRQTQATQELISTMKQTQRDFYGRGMQDRGALPNAIFGADLLKGMRANRIRLGAFR